MAPLRETAGSQSRRAKGLVFWPYVWAVAEGDYLRIDKQQEAPEDSWSQEELAAEIQRVETAMHAAAADLKFEKAATLRDRARYLRQRSLVADA